MTAIKGIDENIISIECNGKEIPVTIPLPFIGAKIFFDDNSIIHIYHAFNQWIIYTVRRGTQPSTLHLCTHLDTTDTYKTIAVPTKIRVIRMGGIEHDMELEF